jgi:two-component system, NarL family, sensor kinase
MEFRKIIRLQILIALLLNIGFTINIYPNVYNRAIVLLKTFPHDEDKFHELETTIDSKIKAHLFEEALDLSEDLEKESIRQKSEYWLSVSFFYQAVCKQFLKDYKTAMVLFQSVLKKKDVLEPDRMANLYRYMGDVYRKMDRSSEAIQCYEKSLVYKDDLKDKSLAANSCFKLAMVYSSQANYKLAKDNYYKTIAIIKTSNDRMTSLVYNNLGNDEYLQGNYQNAIGYYVKSIEFSDKTEDLEVQSLTYNNIGNIYSNQLKNPIKAIDYYSKSLLIEKKRENPKGIASEYNNIGVIYTSQQKYIKAEMMFSSALQIFNTIKDSDGIAITYENYGILYSKKEDYNDALSYFLQSINIRKKTKTEFHLVNVYNNVGAIYFYQKDMKHALIFYLKAFDLAKARNDKSLMKAIYSGIHEAYASLGQYDKAYQYFKAYSEIKDTILNATIARQVIDIQEKYEKTKNEQKIALQNLEIKNKSLQRNGVVVILVLSIFAFGGTIHYIRRQRKNEKLVYEQNSKIKEQEILNLLHQSEIQTMVAKAEGEEKERQRISQELHDRVGSMLTLVKLNLSSHNTEDHPFIKPNLELLENTYKEVRDISHNLYNGLLGKFGLLAALNDLKRTVEANNAMRVNLTSYNSELPLAKESEVVVFRVLQELIANALKHAKASNLDIQINDTDEGFLSVTIEDDGVGFDPAQLKNEGLGLKNVQYRVLSIGGTIEISSAQSKGTCIVLNVPVSLAVNNQA